MTGFLLDTNVVSELRKPRPHGGVLAWFRQVREADLFLSSVSIGEIQAGIELTRRQDPEKALHIESWLNALAQSYNILPMDAACFRQWAILMHRRSSTLNEDAMIAATAKVHGLVVVTRNVADYKSLDVDLLNPFSS